MQIHQVSQHTLISSQKVRLTRDRPGILLVVHMHACLRGETLLFSIVCDFCCENLREDPSRSIQTHRTMSLNDAAMIAHNALETVT